MMAEADDSIRPPANFLPRKSLNARVFRCPELEACISSVLWCDGVRHCPSGFDEHEENCSYRLGVTLLYVAIGAGALGIFLILLLATGCLKYCLYRRRRLQRRQLQKKIPPQVLGLLLSFLFSSFFLSFFFFSPPCPRATLSLALISSTPERTYVRSRIRG
jgi:hypothetical protein